MKKYQLKSLIDVKRGASLAGEYYSNEGSLVRLTLGNFKEEGGFKFNTSKENLYYTGPVKDEYILKKGDIITPLTEQVIGLLGATARIPESDKYVQSGDVALIKSISDELYEGYCYYLISSDVVRKQLSAAAQQTKIRHTSPEKIKNCQVFLPDVSTQIKISNLLDAIDKKISLNVAINDNLSHYLDLIYDFWFSQFDFPNKDNIPYKSNYGAMSFSQKLRKMIPRDWEVVPLKKIATIGSESVIPQAKTEYSHYSIPSFDELRLPKVELGSLIGSTKYKVSSDMVLVSKLNPQFKRVWLINNAEENSICSTEFIPFEAKDIPIEYLFGILNSNSFNKYMIQCSSSSTGSRKRMTPELCLQFSVALPPIEIINEYSTKVRGALKHISDNLHENSKLNTIRKTLLPLLINGQATISD